jgi:pimeloyl-ACP methyl ester carboxylesterase
MKDFDKQHVKIAEISSFFAGGKRVTLTDQPQKHVQVARNGPPRLVDLNGDYVTRQCYVQHVRLAEPDYETPIMFWHGGGMTGVTWETTPDGRPGWQMRFLQAGFDTYVCDAVERGRSGWSPFPEIYDTAPIFRTRNEAWELFRFGAPDGYSNKPDECQPHAGLLFPISSLDNLAAQFVPRWTTHGQETLEAYFDVLKRTGPVWLIAHSQGGNFALEAAARHPEFFRGVVIIEPASAPEDIGKAKQVPHLFIWSDYIGNSPTWVSYRERADAYAAALVEAGGFVETLDLPADGIQGNSHVPMMDVNSDHVADLVRAWIDRVR